jgi:hypothetical protein
MGTPALKQSLLNLSRQEPLPCPASGNTVTCGQGSADSSRLSSVAQHKGEHLLLVMLIQPTFIRFFEWYKIGNEFDVRTKNIVLLLCTLYQYQYIKKRRTISFKKRL